MIGRWLEGSVDATEGDLRKALDDAQVRTGDDVALRRVWSKVSQATSPLLWRRATPRWRWFVGGVASSAVLAAVLALVFWPGRAPFHTPGAPPSRSIAVARAAESARPAPSSLRPRRRLVTGPASVEAPAGQSLAVELAGGVTASLSANAMLVIDDQQRPTVLFGAVHFSVPHQAPGRSFVVAAAGYRVVVVGTKFLVSSGARVAVDVDEGVVEVWRETTPLARLAVGESWSGVPALALAPAAVAPPHVRARSARLARGKRIRAQARAAMVALDEGGPVALDGTARAGKADADIEGALAAGDVRRSLELYGEVLSRGGPAAENAAYEIGRILRDRLHQPEAAVAAWRRYRDQNPNGVLRVEAEVSIVETLVRLGDRDGALVEAARFLRQYPDSERRGEIARIAGDLERAAGSCQAALQFYDVALQSRRPAPAEAAASGRAACLRVLRGDSGGESARITTQ